MYFYKDTLHDIFYIGDDVLPSGRYILRINKLGTIVSVESADTHKVSMPPIEVVNLQKENNTYYTDLAELLVETKDFFSDYAGDILALEGRVGTIENTQLKILYYEEIDGTTTSGQIIIPTGTQILFNQWENNVDAVLSNISVDKPDFKDTWIDVTSLDSNGNYTLSGILATDPAAFIYYLLVPISSISVLNIDRIIDQSILFTTSGSSRLAQNVITVAKLDGDFSSIKEAVDSITDNSQTIRYTIQVSPGVYSEQNPIQCKSYVTIESTGIHMGRIVAANPNQDLFLGAHLSYVIGFSLVNVTGVNNYAVNHSTPGEFILKDCVITDCSNGVLLNNSNALINILTLSLYTPTMPLITGLDIRAGNATVEFIKVISDATIATVINADGVSTLMSIHDFHSLSQNVTTIFKFTNGCKVSGAIMDAGFSTDGMVISGSNTSVKMDVLKMVNVTNDGFRIENVGTGLELTMFSITITGSGALNVNVLNPNIIVSGNGYTEMNKFYAVSGSKFYAYILDISEDDEGLNVLGELHVGTPENPTESVFGEGDSYTNGMLVYSYDGTSYVDISAEMSSPSGSPISLPNGNVNTAFYFGSSRQTTEDYVKHYGFKMKQTKAGGGSSYDILVTGATSPTIVAGNYNKRSTDFNNNPVYVREDNLYWLFNIQGYWCLNDSPPESTSDFSDTKYISTLLEGNYTGISTNTGTPNVSLGQAGIIDYFVFEYYNNEQAAWIPMDAMQTMSNAPYVPIKIYNAILLTGSYQIRYDMELKDLAWGKTDNMGIGTPYYWTRARIIAPLIALPEFEQFKIHSNRMELNGDGWPEYFGTARPISTIPWDLGLVRPANSSPGNQDLFVADVLGVGRVENLLVNGNVDRLGFNGYLPLDLDTSTGVYLRFSYIGIAAVTGNVKFVIRWGYTSDGDNIYINTANAPAIGPNQQTITIIQPMPGVAELQETIQTKLSISRMVSRRIGTNNVGFGDTLWVTVERTGNDVLDTYAGNVAIVNIQPLYLKWCEGGHI